MIKNIGNKYETELISIYKQSTKLLGGSNDIWNTALVPDILKTISKSKKDNQVFVGFCAFTGSIEEARMTIKEKIIQKGCDYLFANPIDLEGQGFGFLAQNEGWLFDTNNMEHYINKTSKIDLANKLITQIISLKK